MARVIGILAAVIVLAGCGDGARFATLPPSDATAMLVAFVGETETVVRAGPPDRAVRFDLTADVDGRLALAFFDDPLEVPTGVLTSSEDRNARLLPASSSTYVATFIEGEVGAWKATNVIDEALASIRLPPRTDLAVQCAWQGQPRVALADPGYRGPVGLVDGAVAIAFSGRVVLVEPSRATTSYELPPNRSVVLGDGAPEGRVVFSSSASGGLWRNTLERDGSITTATITAGITEDRFVEAHRIGDAMVFRTFDARAVLLEGDVLTVLGPVDARYRIAAAVDRQGRRVVASNFDIYTIEDGELFRRVELDQRVLDLVATAEGELVAATFPNTQMRGRLVRIDLDRGRAEMLHDTGTEGEVSTMVATARGVSYVAEYDLGGALGAAYHFVPGFGSCEGALARFESPPDIVEFAEGFAVVLRTPSVELVPFAAP